VSVSVSDDGEGMPPDVARRAGEPFFTTKMQGKGTGLGLAQVFGFARQCGGEVRILTAVGTGTKIDIVLPVAEPDVMPGTADQAPKPISASTRQRARIVVIDDDDGVRAVIRQALADAGFDVQEAIDGPSGLRLLASHQPDLAVIDFMMPGMNGAEVARRAQALRPSLPIVFVSGYADTLALDGIAGATVLRKPFEVDGLLLAVERALGVVAP